MYYEKHITTTANTDVFTKQTTNVRITSGVIFHFEVFFPAGQKATTRVQVFWSDHQIFPATRGDYMSGDDRHLVIREHVKIPGPPLNIRIKTWNLSTRYDHEVMVAFTMLPERLIDPMFAVNKLINQLRIFLGRFGVG